MPCWYFERKEIRDSPSFKQGIDQATENRYRREGARLILDAGTKLGLRYDTCATGVVYFHRFYTTHSFREFHRYVMSACCLFLAGKVEETPKKCRDIIRTVQTLLKEDVFNAAFGEDPREEVMTTERILLQTVKFDLQVEHPYHFLLNFAKQIKGDKDKIQKMAQMAWTFINDSLCTTLCLQWESEIIAVSLMYLASRLTKFEPTDWTGRISGSRSKWWEDLIEGMTMELMEDICHQVLDLYSAQQQAQKQEGREVSPPLAAGPRPAVQTPGPRDTPPPPPRDPPPPPKRTRNTSPGEALVAGNKAKKVKPERDESSASSKHNTPSSSTAVSSKPSSPNPKAGPGTGGQVSVPSVNPYVSSSMYSSSFMSQEGQQSIASLLGGNSATPLPPAPQAQPYPNYPPPSTPSQYHVPPPGPYTPGSYPPPPAPGQYHTPPPYSVSYNAPPYGQSTPSTYSSAPLPSNATPSSAYPLPPPAPYSAPPPNLPPPPHPGSGYPYPPPIGQPPPHIPPPGFGAPPPGNYGAPPPPIPQHRGGRGNRLNQSNLAPVRCISDRGGIR